MLRVEGVVLTLNSGTDLIAAKRALKSVCDSEDSVVTVLGALVKGTSLSMMMGGLMSGSLKVS